MKFLLLILCVVMILAHTKVKIENHVIKVEIDFNRVVGKIKKLAEKL